MRIFPELKLKKSHPETVDLKIFRPKIPPHICLRCARSLCCQQRAKSSARRWLCTFSALPAHITVGTMAYYSAGRCCCAHPLCCQQDMLTRHFLNMQSVPAVHILCAASTHHGRIRSMLLSLYVECIRCAHSLCCQQAASRMPPREQHQKYKLSLPKNVALILHKQLFERIWLQMLSQSQDHHTTVTL